MIALGLALFGVVQQNLRSRNLGAHYGAGMFESGTSRVLVELGVPGALGLGSVMIALGLALFGVVQQNLRSRNLGAHYGAGMFACFVANIGSLVVSGQILADPFIASFLGVLAGLTLSLARPELQGGDSRTLAHQRAVVAAARRLSGRGY